MKQYTVGVIGATGAVGKEMVNCLYQRNFPVSSLHLLASERSAGKKAETPYGAKEIELFTLEKTRDLDFVFLAVSGDFAREYAPKIAAGRATVIDNSSAFRMDDTIPLVVPEVNPQAVKGAKLIANPNCTTAILAVALYPLHQAFGVKKVIVSTYQATSGGGQEAMDELRTQTANYLQGAPVEAHKFAHPIPFNLIPRIDVMTENGYTKEEMKVARETRKIFANPEMLISCTAVRIPTFRAHAEAVTIETVEKITPEAAIQVLTAAQGIKLVNDAENFVFPMPLTATEQDDVEVGRIRQNLVFGDHGLDFFVCGDQLLKGAALNAVQIAELLI